MVLLMVSKRLKRWGAVIALSAAVLAAALFFIGGGLSTVPRLSMDFLTGFAAAGSAGFTAGNQQAEQPVEPVHEDFFRPPVILFCPRDDCAQNLEFMINSSSVIHCALFDVDVPGIISALDRRGAQVVVDDTNYAKEMRFARKDTSSQLSHNKFCVFDSRIVWTGSYNPTFRDSYKNNNNAVIFFSETLAKNYEGEFSELWEGEYGRGQRVKYPKIMAGDTLVESYFCPEDWCANKVLDALSAANKSILFMAFSFTHQGIADMLIRKKKQGLDVVGVMEKSQNSNYSQFSALAAAGIGVRWDHNKYNMHHKVFIIDNRTVITGSFNPTKNADLRNDENMVIVHDPEFALRFIEEFSGVYNAG